MSDPKEPQGPASWKHDVKLGLDPLRDAVARARQTAAAALKQAELELARHRTALERFQGR